MLVVVLRATTRSFALALGVCALVPAGALGAQVGIRNGLTYQAAPGERNEVIIQRPTAKQFRLRDGGANITLVGAAASRRCRSESSSEVRCTVRSASETRVDLGDGDDRLRAKSDVGRFASRSGGLLFAYGGAGNDRLKASGRGEVTLGGGTGEDRLRGGDGNDFLAGGPGTDVLAGGKGMDIASFEGGDGTTAPRGPVVVTLDGRANDGVPGENDLVGADIEGVDGPSSGRMPDPLLAGNRITGNDATNTLYGSGTLSGLGGPDDLNGSDSADRLLGGTGNDVLQSSGGHDTFVGGEGDDRVYAVDLGPPPEEVVPVAIVPEADETSCGAGYDIAFLDSSDPRPADCELTALVTDDPAYETKFFGPRDVDTHAATIEGTAAADRISGSHFNDRVRGLAGDDRINGGRGTEDFGDDRLDGGPGDDRLTGGEGYDTLTGRSGRDRLTGGPGRDRLSGGAGRDRLDVRDGERDTVRCGSERDRVIADSLDRVARDCEKVSRAQP
jgi:Ca2+-binding RTX toxin-like protein